MSPDLSGVVGFTGTRHGMTPEQIGTVDELTVWANEVHHGDCLGADFDMHRIAYANGQQRVSHPPSDPRLRAYADAEVVLEPKPYHDRNRDIVDAADWLVATPAESTEQEKGGTWYTVRYARLRQKPVVIVWPDGSTSSDEVAS